MLLNLKYNSEITQSLSVFTVVIFQGIKETMMPEAGGDGVGVDMRRPL